MRSQVRVAAVQAEPKWLRLKEGVEQVIDLIDTAAAAGAQLVAFPETFLPGYPWWQWAESNQWNLEYSTRARENSMIRDGVEMHRIASAARRNGIQVVLGFGERQERRIFMAQAVISDKGKVLSVRRKAGLNPVERKVFASGAPQLPTAHRGALGVLGALSGQENQRTLLTRALRADEEQIHVAAWPGGPGEDSSPALASATVSRMYALEGHAFVVAPSAVVGEAARVVPGTGGAQLARFGSRARIFAADGSELVTPLAEGVEGILYADLELGAGERSDQDLDIGRPLRDRRAAVGSRDAARRGRVVAASARVMPMSFRAYSRFAGAC